MGREGHKTSLEWQRSSGIMDDGTTEGREDGGREGGREGARVDPFKIAAGRARQRRGKERSSRHICLTPQLSLSRKCDGLLLPSTRRRALNFRRSVRVRLSKMLIPCLPPAVPAFPPSALSPLPREKSENQARGDSDILPLIRSDGKKEQEESSKYYSAVREETGSAGPTACQVPRNAASDGWQLLIINTYYSFIRWRSTSIL